jgi:hypothetical protein
MVNHKGAKLVDKENRQIKKEMRTICKTEFTRDHQIKTIGSRLMFLSILHVILDIESS